MKLKRSEGIQANRSILFYLAIGPFLLIWRIIKFFYIALAAPGYIILWLQFYFPTEWGENRNVTRGGRAWSNKHTMAPIYALGFYIVLIALATS